MLVLASACMCEYLCMERTRNYLAHLLTAFIPVVVNIVIKTKPLSPNFMYNEDLVLTLIDV